MVEAVVASVNLLCHQLDRFFEFYRQLFALDEIEEHRSPIYRALRFGDSGRSCTCWQERFDELQWTAVKNAEVLLTMDSAQREIHHGSVYIEGNVIVKVGSDTDVVRWIAADQKRLPVRTIDATGCVVLPGLVNCHHHLYQTLMRSIGTGRGLVLFDWLKLLYPLWAQMNPKAVHISAKLALCELMLCGATTVADHLYLFPDGAWLDDEITAAQALGVRFHPTRGSMSLGESDGGLPPDSVVENEEAILADSLRVIQKFHDPAPHSMLRIGLAPCSPFSVTGNPMRESARMARAHRAGTRDGRRRRTSRTWRRWYDKQRRQSHAR